MGARRLAGLAVLLTACACASPSPEVAQVAGEAAARCEGLRAFTEAGIQVTAATPVTPSPEWTPPGPPERGVRPVTTPFCRVEGMIDGRVGFELWLPDGAAWNGRMLGAGVGGDAGYFNIADIAKGVNAGFASITSDGGHKAGDPAWMMRADALDDYTHRGQHLMNVAGRALIDAYYGAPPKRAYFIGCSGGGRQGLKEIQRYPQDYDGVIAGAPGPAMPVMSVRHMWQAVYQQQNPEGAMSDADWDVVAAAVVARCDANDGLADGVVANPSRCEFDPSTVLCSPGQVDGCLPAAKVQTVKTFYAPMRDEDGVQLDDGLVPGVRTRPGPPSPLLLPFFAQGAHRDPNWSPMAFNRKRDLALADARMPEMRADQADLSGFVARGGRVIMYQGWLDASVIAGQSLGYVKAVREKMGEVVADRHLKLYMAPGMLHCAGGSGPDHFGGAFQGDPLGDASHDVLAALVAWVEEGREPGPIIASKIENGEVTMQRPLCPHPQEAVHVGGDGRRAESFRCEIPG